MTGRTASNAVMAFAGRSYLRSRAVKNDAMDKPNSEASVLIISRTKNESLVIGDDIRITVVECRGDKIRLAISCPQEVPIWRKEVYDLLQDLNQLFPEPRARAKRFPPSNPG
jgi:carbon storage regulator